MHTYWMASHTSVRIAVLVALVWPADRPALAQATSRPVASPREASPSLARTPWGDPDLQGTWDFTTITPLQRPANLAGKEFLTESEAAELEKNINQQRFQIEDTSPGSLGEGMFRRPWRATAPARCRSPDSATQPTGEGPSGHSTCNRQRHGDPCRASRRPYHWCSRRDEVGAADDRVLGDGRPHRRDPDCRRVDRFARCSRCLAARRDRRHRIHREPWPGEGRHVPRAGRDGRPPLALEQSKRPRPRLLGAPHERGETMANRVPAGSDRRVKAARC